MKIIRLSLFLTPYTGLDYSTKTKSLMARDNGKLVYSCENFFSSLKSPTTFDERFKVTSVPIVILDFNLLSCELHDLTFKMLYYILYRYFIQILY